jgi:hypothetical protein
LRKIHGMIEAADFGIFDITTWNPNVTLELGIAVGANRDYYIAFNPTVDQAEPPADLGGIDRIQYTDYAELDEQLDRLMSQPVEATPRAEDGTPPAAVAPAPRPTKPTPNIDMRLTLLNCWRVGKEIQRTTYFPAAESRWASETVKHLMKGDPRDLERFVGETKLGISCGC